MKKQHLFIEMSESVYEATLAQIGTLIDRTLLEQPEDSDDEGGTVKLRDHINYVELRLIEAEDDDPAYYVYSQADWKLFTARSIQDAVNIMAREERKYNRQLREENKRVRRKSLQMFNGETDPFLQSVQAVINRRRPGKA